MMAWGHDMYGWGGHWPGGILMIVVSVLVIGGLMLLAKGAFSPSGAGSAAALESPENILRRRYARGELDKAEFEQKRKDILGS